MPQADTRCDVRREQGFDLFALRNDHVELVVVPELGAKVVSLKNAHTGREWLWSPSAERRLFANSPGDSFSDGPLIGWDECLPTIAPCEFGGRALPDHGDAWTARFTFNDSLLQAGTFRTTFDLPKVALTFTRSLTLRENSVIADYTLTSRSTRAEKFIWAMHPLLAVQEGDRLEIPQAARRALSEVPWIPTLIFGSGGAACAKCFISAELCHDTTAAVASVVNHKTGDKLSIEWDAAENDTLGLWLTRGGWHGHHHLAIEPTNAAADSLADAAVQNHCGSILPGASKTWRVILRLQPSAPTNL